MQKHGENYDSHDRTIFPTRNFDLANFFADFEESLRIGNKFYSIWIDFSIRTKITFYFAFRSGLFYFISSVNISSENKIIWRIVPDLWEIEMLKLHEQFSSCFNF